MDCDGAPPYRLELCLYDGATPTWMALCLNVTLVVKKQYRAIDCISQQPSAVSGRRSPCANKQLRKVNFN